MLQQFGYTLHTLQDFYSHSNYADLNLDVPFSWNSIPGIGNTTTPYFWDLEMGNMQVPELPDERLSSSCYPNSTCEKNRRSNHEQNNKDKADINVITGDVTNPGTSRGQLEYYGITNAQRAVHLAIEQTRLAWVNLQSAIIQKEGPVRGNKIICAIASDRPNDCGKSQANAQSAMPIAQPEAPSDFEQPFDWIVKAYQQAEVQMQQSKVTGAYVAPVNLARIARSDSSIWTNCGTAIIDPRPVEMGDDTDQRLIVTRLRVQGISCKKATRQIKNKRLSNTQMGRNIKSPLQCIAIPDSETPPAEDALVVCKNKKESIQMMFTPDCPEGECGL